MPILEIDGLTHVLEVNDGFLTYVSGNYEPSEDVKQFQVPIEEAKFHDKLGSRQGHLMLVFDRSKTTSWYNEGGLFVPPEFADVLLAFYQAQRPGDLVGRMVTEFSNERETYSVGLRVA